jgi:hypothetical protein
MMLAMVFVFGAAAYLSARDYEADMCKPFYGNGNVTRRVGEVRRCGVDLTQTLRTRQIVLQVRGGAGVARIVVEQQDRIVRRGWLTTPERPEPELVLGADPMFPTSFVQTH